MKRFITLLIVSILLSGSLAFAENKRILEPCETEKGGDAIQCVTLYPDGIKVMSGPGTVDVTEINLIVFDATVGFYEGANSTKVFSLPAYMPLIIGKGVLSIYIDGAANYIYR